jgi:hypothetical protein
MYLMYLNGTARVNKGDFNTCIEGNECIHFSVKESPRDI